jgi:hypothetical protein
MRRDSLFAGQRLFKGMARSITPGDDRGGFRGRRRALVAISRPPWRRSTPTVRPSLISAIRASSTSAGEIALEWFCECDENGMRSLGFITGGKVGFEQDLPMEGA